MQINFDVSNDVFLKAGVAVLNPEFNPEVPYSQEIMITHPERMSSYGKPNIWKRIARKEKEARMIVV
jgi:hypothetical protein